MQTDLMETLRWLRVVGDTIFAVGIIGIGVFVVGLKTGHSTISSGPEDLERLVERTPPKREPAGVR
jgi:nitric oxide reductase subunit B